MLLSLIRPRTRLPTARTVAADSLLHCATSKPPTRTAPHDSFHDPEDAMRANAFNRKHASPLGTSRAFAPSSRQTCRNGTTACHGRARRHDELRTLAPCANKSRLSVQRGLERAAQDDEQWWRGSPAAATATGRSSPRLLRAVVGHDAGVIKHAVRDASQVLLGIASLTR